MKMKRNLLTTAFICLLVLLLSSAHAQPTMVGEGGEIEVDIDEETPSISIYSLNEYLFSIEYTTFEFYSSEHSAEIPLEGEWEVKTENIKDGAFPHLRVTMDRKIELFEKEIDLHFQLNILHITDTVEVTYFFEISRLKDIPLGTFTIIQELDVNGEIVKDPGLVIPERDPILFYEFSLSKGITGYYSWSSIANVDGETQDARVNTSPDGQSLYLGIEYDDPEADSVSISPLEKSKTSVLVPLPEAYDRLPSFLVGTLVAGGFVIGLLFQERSRFYRKQDPAKTVRLEDSPYYRGKE